MKTETQEHTVPATTESGLQIIAPDELASATQVLRQNKSYLTIYEKSQAKLKALAEQEGTKLSPKTDEEINKWQVSAKLAIKAMNEQRAPITSILHRAVKMFTEVENGMTEKYNELQAIRDKSVTAYRKEEEEKRKAEEMKLKKAQERVTLLANAEQEVRQAYANYLSEAKSKIEKGENVDDVLSFTWWESITPEISSGLLAKEEIHAIQTESKLGKFDKCAKHYADEIAAYKKHIASLADKSGAEQERLKAEQEAAEQAKQKAEQKRQAELQAETERIKLEQANRAVQAPDTRVVDSYAVTVTGADGWRAIVEFYLSNGGGDDLEKITGKQMRAFAEKMAKKTGECVEHSEVKYEKVYKSRAVAGKGDGK